MTMMSNQNCCHHIQCCDGVVGDFESGAVGTDIEAVAVVAVVEVVVVVVGIGIPAG